MRSILDFKEIIKRRAVKQKKILKSLKNEQLNLSDRLEMRESWELKI